MALGASAMAAADARAVGGAPTAQDPSARIADLATAGIARRHARFVVRYRDGSAEAGDARAAQRGVDSALARSGLALPGKAGGLRIAPLRRTATGAHVLRASRGLDPVEAGRFLAQLRADPAVERAVVDRLLAHAGLAVEAAAAPSPDDPDFAELQWHLHGYAGGVHATEAWHRADGAGITVAVLDTGITRHPDLDANMLEGYDFITDPVLSRRDGAERVPGGWDLGTWNDDPALCELSYSSWHGTHVAGTVAQATGNGIGLAGTAPRAKVLPMRVLGRCGFGYDSDIADAIVWASGDSVAGVPDNPDPAEVINLSLAGLHPCEPGSEMQLAIDAAVANGSAVVVAAGNSAWRQDVAGVTPAGCANVIAVGATNPEGDIAYYSNVGAGIDLSAPGGDIVYDVFSFVWQASHDSLEGPVEGGASYAGMMGTSMAAPHVAGVAALVQSVAATPLTPAQLEDLLVATARPFPYPVRIPPSWPIGVGIVDAGAAVSAVLDPPCVPAEPCARPLLPMPVFDRQPAAGLEATAGDALLFALEVPAGTRALSLATHGGTGDADLLVSFGAPPDADTARLRSRRPGTNAETLRVMRPRAGTWFIRVQAAQSYRGVTLDVRH
ncbi:S8 family serine peptidase [Luteimonas sp. RD2P54]|uniref:S8 family serine peptidase n=1 Tax=Luteimonas endophytica TaxID=3042023 RepID=A0ABT6JD56_9GAMM|nr:S8 family peptidase [Luteimonas endophytica]MDH5824760.1 S8 family serine peptidase [Luteimonas endophytica]